MELALYLIGTICLGYFFCIAFFAGHGTNFYLIWLFAGAFAIAWGVLIKKGIWSGYLPALPRRLFLLLISFLMILFVTVEGFIISGFPAKGKPGLDYLIVLGAQMKKNGPSKSLQYRLDAACAYLENNPGTLVVVSGGKGSDEPVSEAQGMYDYLVEKGIRKERILLEDQSKNTFQNLTFSAGLLDKEKASVGIVTNNFHVFRAVRIARKAGYKNVCGIAAKAEPFLQPNNMMREFFGVAKDFLVGNM